MKFARVIKVDGVYQICCRDKVRERESGKERGGGREGEREGERETNENRKSLNNRKEK